MKTTANLFVAAALAYTFSGSALAIVSPDAGSSYHHPPAEKAREYHDDSAYIAMADHTQQTGLLTRYDRSGR